MNHFQLELNKNISIQNRLDDLSEVIDAARTLIAEQLGVTSKEVALMRNGTEANNNINNGQILNKTDEVWFKAPLRVIHFDYNALNFWHPHFLLHLTCSNDKILVLKRNVTPKFGAYSEETNWRNFL